MGGPRSRPLRLQDPPHTSKGERGGERSEGKGDPPGKQMARLSLQGGKTEPRDSCRARPGPPRQSCRRRPAASPAGPGPPQLRPCTAAQGPGRPHRPARSRRAQGSDSRCATASSRLCREFLSGPCGRLRSAKPAMLCAEKGRAQQPAPPPEARGSLGLVVPSGAGPAGHPRGRREGCQPGGVG